MNAVHIEPGDRCPHCDGLLWLHQDGRGQFDPCPQWPDGADPAAVLDG